MPASVLPIKLPYHFARPPHVATYHMCRAKLSTRQVRLLFGELANTAEQIEAVLVDTSAQTEMTCTFLVKIESSIPKFIYPHSIEDYLSSVL